ncbi:MAG: hypothetical protein QNJ46_35185 [Leptolyngbyaceae cyanobacterium MO_188.B28]|nr:hypothetical protein [Leptolyngbyaceae cyanobacterium MO_188.B28]
MLVNPQLCFDVNNVTLTYYRGLAGNQALSVYKPGPFKHSPFGRRGTPDLKAIGVEDSAVVSIS